MAKIPVGATIAHAYRFAFGEFLQILGVIWLPFVLGAAGSLLIIRQVVAAMNAITTQNAAAMGSDFLIVLPVYVVAFVFLAMEFAGVTKLALSLQQKPVYFYFSLGKPVWRLIGAYLLVIVIFVVAYIVTLIGAVIVGGISAAVVGVTVGAKSVVGIAAIVLVTALITLVFFGAMIYGLTRLTFLLAPVVIAEEKIGLGRAWSLGRGNFWRMFVIMLAIMLPVIAIEFAGIFALWGRDFMALGPGATPAQFMAAEARIIERSLSYIRSYWFIVYPLLLAFSAIFLGLICGARAYAYRALVPGENAEARS